VFRRAPFVWSARQQIDPAGLVRAFMQGRMRRESEGANRWFLLRRRFELAAAPEAGELRLTVDGRYQLFANGARVGRGPVRCDPLHQRFDRYDPTAWLRTGENVLALLVRVYGIDTAWYQTVKGLWQPCFGDGGLWCEGSLRVAGREVLLQSDLEWRCLECPAWERETPRANWGLPAVEVCDARALPAGWTEPGFDDSGWDAVQELRSGGGPPDGFFGGMRTEPFPTLLPREIPFLEERPLAPERAVRCYAALPRPELPVDRRLYQEELRPAPEGLVEKPEALLDAGPDATLVRTGPGCDVSLVLDFGRIHTGYPRIELDARGGEVVELAVAEGIPGEWDEGGPREPLRLDRERGHGAHLFRYTARPGPQRFESFEWKAVRWAQLTVRDAPEGLRIRHVGSLSTLYPVEERGAFECSDPLLDRLWEIGKYTLRLCMHDGWEDCPGREQRQWLGDATVEALVAQAAFGPSANALNRQFLVQAAESQRADGLTQMFAPGDHREHALLIPDWTLQWVLNAGDHWLYTGELDAIEAIFPAIERALAWFERQLGPNDLLCDTPYWHFMDWAALGRHGEAAAQNAQYAGALRAAARLARALESPRAARRYDALAARVAAALERHWDARRGVYVDCADPETGAQDPRVSQHANAGAILWDAAPPERWAGIAERIADPARLRFTAAPPIVPSGEAFDPERDVVLANTFYSHFVYRALAKAGRFDLALALVRQRYGSMLERGATTLWESFDPTASLCHGFSATPVYQLSTEVLGILPLEPGFRRFRFRPQPADLAFARGVFPTVLGDVCVAWERVGAGLRAEIEVPEGAVAVVPGGPELGPGSHDIEIPLP
jgi:alpha-L-rhamnosidase